jgi:hypothetical protein
MYIAVKEDINMRSLNEDNQLWLMNEEQRKENEEKDIVACCFVSCCYVSCSDSCVTSW